MKTIKIPLEDQVVERETARELAEKLNGVGIEMETAFIWQCNKHIWEVDRSEDRYMEYGRYCVPAPTLPEMLAVLPARIDDKWWIHIDKSGAHYLDDNFKSLVGYLTTEKLNIETCLALCNIWLIDNGHIKGGQQK